MKSEEEKNIMLYCLYVVSKELIQMNFFIKQEQIHNTENKFMSTKGERRRGINKESGINLYTVPNTK